MTAVTPIAWGHPVWQLASDVLQTPLHPLVTLNPWRTETELMKLLTYAMAAWLACLHATKSERAWILLHALITIGAFYAFYSLVMNGLGKSQLELFYSGKSRVMDVAAPFVNRNSCATFFGLVTLCAGSRLVEEGWLNVSVGQGGRRFWFLLLHYLSGRGVPFAIATVLVGSTLIATSSRAGNFSTLAGMTVLLVLSAFIARRRAHIYWIASIGCLVFCGAAFLFTVNGDPLAVRLNDLAQTGATDDLRPLLWSAAARMIQNAPALGLGLGTYENAYPLYSDVMLPYVMDRAHNDYLELAAGWGLPAAILWWAAIAWLLFLCLRGAFVRRRNQIYPLLAVGAGVLVGIHALFDFSLQIPAISLIFAAILGLGVAQSSPSSDARASLHASKDKPGYPLDRIVICVALLPALVVCVLALPRFFGGLAEDAAVPVTARMKKDIAVSVNAARSAAVLLAYGPSRDGETLILRAVASADAQSGDQDVVNIVHAALLRAPASARGWILFADFLKDKDRHRAADALTLGLMLAPHEQYLLTPSLKAGAALWDVLPDSAKRTLVDDIHLAAPRPELAFVLEAVVAAPGGAVLVQRAYASEPESLRALNRMMARKHLGL